MKFWDSSAIVSLIVKDSHTDTARSIFALDRWMVTAFVAPLEIESALWRRRHAGQLNAEQHETVDRNFAALTGDGWHSIELTEELFNLARRLVAIHPLRTMDAIQLASAVVASDFNPRRLAMVTFDEDLAVAARVEGFSVFR